MQSVTAKPGTASSSKKIISILRKPSQKENVPRLDIIAHQPNKPHHHRSTHDIPVKFHGVLYWVSGLGRQSTCHDVIVSLLQKVSDGCHDVQSEAGLCSVWERWREVERPLKNKTRILKVWRAWGTECHDVCFYLRKDSGDHSTQVRSRRKDRQQDDVPSSKSRAGERLRKAEKRKDMFARGHLRRSISLDKLARIDGDGSTDSRPSRHPLLASEWRSTHCLLSSECTEFRHPYTSYRSTHQAQTTEIIRHHLKSTRPPPPPPHPASLPRHGYPHPGTHVPPQDNATIPIPTKTYYDLVQTILNQERQIQEQLQRLQNTDQEIESHENQVHLMRMRHNGDDYVQKAYMNSPVKEQHSDKTPEVAKDRCLISPAGMKGTPSVDDYPDLQYEALPNYCTQTEVMSAFKSRFGGQLMPPLEGHTPPPQPQSGICNSSGRLGRQQDSASSCKRLPVPGLPCHRDRQDAKESRTVRQRPSDEQFSKIDGIQIIEESFQEQPLLLHGGVSTGNIAVLSQKIEQSFMVSETQGQLLNDLNTTLKGCHEDLVNRREKMFQLYEELREQDEAAGTWEDTESFLIPPEVTSPETQEHVIVAAKVKSSVPMPSNLDLAFRGEDDVCPSPIERRVEESVYQLEETKLTEYLAGVKLILDDADSNSESGLSSMPSDESLHEFETLV